MKRWLLLLAWALAGLAQPAAAAAAPEPQAPQQVMVMLNIPAPHFRPDGNSSGGYADAAGHAARRRAAAALARAYGLQMATDWAMPSVGLDCYVMDVPASMNAPEVAERLAREPNVALAQVMNIFRSLAHDDPLFSMQPAAAQWHLDELHRVASGRGVRVAIVDSGVQADHPDLKGQIESRRNLLPDRPDAAELHGTAVAGIIAARADDHVGIAGVAPLSRLLALRACWQVSPAETLCNSLGLARALDTAIERGVDIVNLSLGGPRDPLIQRFIEEALTRGISVVAAANPAIPDGGFPATLAGVIAVEATPGHRSTAMVVAPGTDALTSLPGSRWGTVSGASYAAAHVSGLLALIIDARRQGGSSSRNARALTVADLVPDATGRIDACATVARAWPSCGCACPAPAIDSVARH